jgi:hypothetical protein
MEKVSVIGSTVLAEFLMDMAPQKAHWYNLMTLFVSDPSRKQINAVSPQFLHY